jgi:Bacteriophage replication protein O
MGDTRSGGQRMAKRQDTESALPPVDWSRFGGLDAPAYTQVPDDLVDWVMAYLTGAELKVLLYIVRRTFGFKKAADAISIEQLCNGIVTHDGRRLDLGTAMKRSTVLEALRSLRQKNLIDARSQVDAFTGTRPTVYALRLRQREGTPGYDGYQAPGMPEHTPPYARAYPPVRSDIPGGMLEEERGVCQNVPPGYAPAYPQETVKQETVKQETDHSKISNGIPFVNKGEIGKVADAADDDEEHSETIAQVIAGYSILFHDRRHERSNGTRAMRLWRGSRLDEDAFVDFLHEARRITQQRGNIERDATDGSPEGTKNRMPYYFKVLEDLVAATSTGGAHTAA